jgi:glycosyltransferase involved in cell wall biosynthesis
MNANVPRVAFFTDTFHEVNGVALTSRQIHAFARRHGLPFFGLHSGPETCFSSEGGYEVFELRPSRASFGLDEGLSFDPLFLTHRNRVREALRKFQPDLVHVTALGHCSILGALLAHELRVPMVASWHTNIHQFGARRLEKVTALLPEVIRKSMAHALEDCSLAGVLRFYQIARVLLAPNRELVKLLEERTGRPAFLMQRGVDSELFHPAKRRRGDDAFQIGFVGRLTPEKNVRFLADLERALLEAGKTNFRIVVIGQGSERSWLQSNLRYGRLPGVLRGEALAQAYAGLDLFVFPSYSDTFGNVILESLASGVPAVVTSGGGPRYIIRDGVSGFVARDERHFVDCVLHLMDHPLDHLRMRQEARCQAVAHLSWDRVFETMWGHYEACFAAAPRRAGAKGRGRPRVPALQG